MLNITEDELKNFIRDVSIHGIQNKSIVLYQTCLEKGLVERTVLDSQTCDNPECTSCRNFDENISKIFKEELKGINFSKFTVELSEIQNYVSNDIIRERIIIPYKGKNCQIIEIKDNVVTLVLVTKSQNDCLGKLDYIIKTDLKDMQAFKDKYEEIHNSKYYTPSIEEFHVEFECEMFTTKTVNNEQSWSKFEIKDYFHLDTILKSLTKVLTRVKYLDKEDIETLGFKQSISQNYIYLKTVSKYKHLEDITIGINYNKISKELVVFYVPDENVIPAGINIFIGTIKNKSELKVLLKQLNIEFGN